MALALESFFEELEDALLEGLGSKGECVSWKSSPIDDSVDTKLTLKV